MSDRRKFGSILYQTCTIGIFPILRTCRKFHFSPSGYYIAISCRKMGYIIIVLYTGYYIGIQTNKEKQYYA